MSLDKTLFTPIGGQGARGNAPQLFSYTHASDNLATVKGSGYFNDLADMLEPGDVIIFSANGAAVDIITIAAISAAGVVTTQTADINSA